MKTTWPLDTFILRIDLNTSECLNGFEFYTLRTKNLLQ